MNTIDMTLNLTREQRDAWALIRPIIRPHIRKLYRVYWDATPEKQEALVAANKIFGAVMDWVGE